MSRSKTVLCIVLAAVICIPFLAACSSGSFSFKGHKGETVQMDYRNAAVLWKAENGGESAPYLFVTGGYNDPDRGGMWPWGDTKYSEVFFIGDTAGEIVIDYTDGSRECVPLTFGYTLWWREYWNQSSLPFKGEGCDENLSSILRETLCLYGAYEGNESCTLRIKLNGNKKVGKISLARNARKNGCPVITGVSFEDISGNPDAEAFFETHTVDAAKPLNNKIKANLDTLLDAVTTCEEEYLAAPEAEYSAEYKGAKIYFTGTPFANIATGVINFSGTDIGTRMKRNGLFPESLDKTEQLIYGGIGTYSIGGAYSNRMYSRNKVVFTLNGYGFRENAQNVVNYVNKMFMYYPEHNISLLGRQIPGHMTMLVNDPFNYRTTGFPLTKYSDKALYGDEAWNLSNTEQDGHGLMMLSNWVVWKSSGGTAQWVQDNWTYINEAAEWILWCFDNSDITYCNDYVLYAESEGCAGWMGYSLYCNEPCYFGLLGYIEMAEKAGKTAEAKRWQECADKFRKGILEHFTLKDGTWDFSEEGKDRDPTLTFMSYMYGYDTADMDQEFLERAVKSYDGDLKEMIEKDDGYWGPWGTGYDHATMTQNAMLLDKMDDATILMNNLSRICYAPDYPDKYGVPEAFAVDSERNLVRRTGDFENLVHTCDTLLTYLVSLGVSPVVNDSGVLKIMPRLADNWNASVDSILVGNTKADVGLTVQYPENGTQNVEIKINRADTVNTVRYRFGPFDYNTKSVSATLNGGKIEAELIKSGDRAWAWVEFGIQDGGTYSLVADYR